MIDRQPAGGWNTWSQHVLAELERLNQEHKELKKDYDEYRIKAEGRYQSLNIKTGIIGFIGGSIPTIFLIIAELLQLLQ